MREGGTGTVRPVDRKYPVVMESASNVRVTFSEDSEAAAVQGKRSSGNPMVRTGLNRPTSPVPAPYDSGVAAPVISGEPDRDHVPTDGPVRRTRTSIPAGLENFRRTTAASVSVGSVCSINGA